MDCFAVGAAAGLCQGEGKGGEGCAGVVGVEVGCVFNYGGAGEIWLGVGGRRGGTVEVADAVGAADEVEDGGGGDVEN